MGSSFENLAFAMHFTSGSAMGYSRTMPTEAYIANLSDNNLIVTALLPEDADPERSLLVRILDQTEAAIHKDPREPSVSPQELNRERILRPGEVAMLALRKVPKAKHISLFRVRKEGATGLCFLKYTVKVNGHSCLSSIAHLGTQNTLGKLENTHPHLLYIW